MNPQNDKERLRKDYLLGRLSDDMRDQVEERLLDDNDFVEKLSTTEDDLIDDYVFGALSASERKNFEENFVISDERRRKVQFAQSVGLYLELADPQVPARPAPWWEAPLQFLRSYKLWIAIPVLGLLLLLLIVPPVVRWIKPGDTTVVVQTNRALIEQQIAEFNKRSTDPGLAAYDMDLESTPVLRDKGGIKRVTLSRNIKALNLKLALSSTSSHAKYRALVSTVEGVELFAVENLERESEAGTAVVHLKIPTEFFNTGDYQIQLGGIRPDGQSDSPVRYYFGVIK